jgi:hypothetical protein
MPMPNDNFSCIVSSEIFVTLWGGPEWIELRHADKSVSIYAQGDRCFWQYVHRFMPRFNRQRQYGGGRKPNRQVEG